MWIKIDNDKYWATGAEITRLVFTGESCGAVSCISGPGCTVPFTKYIFPGMQVAFVDRENDMWDIGRVFEEQITIKDEMTLIKFIDRLDNEIALEKLEAL